MARSRNNCCDPPHLALEKKREKEKKGKTYRVRSNLFLECMEFVNPSTHWCMNNLRVRRRRAAETLRFRSGTQRTQNSMSLKKWHFATTGAQWRCLGLTTTTDCSWPEESGFIIQCCLLFCWPLSFLLPPKTPSPPAPSLSSPHLSRPRSRLSSFATPGN